MESRPINLHARAIDDNLTDAFADLQLFARLSASITPCPLCGEKEGCKRSCPVIRWHPERHIASLYESDCDVPLGAEVLARSTGREPRPTENPMLQVPKLTAWLDGIARHMKALNEALAGIPGQPIVDLDAFRALDKETVEKRAWQPLRLATANAGSALSEASQTFSTIVKDGIKPAIENARSVLNEVGQ